MATVQAVTPVHVAIIRGRKFRNKIGLQPAGALLAQGRADNLLHLAVMQIYAGPKFHNAKHAMKLKTNQGNFRNSLAVINRANKISKLRAKYLSARCFYVADNQDDFVDKRNVVETSDKQNVVETSDKRNAVETSR